MVLHYSVNFENDPFTYHGEVDYPLNFYQDCEPYAESMAAFVKAGLVDSIRKWGFTPDQIVKVDFYFYRGVEERIFFHWEKDTSPELTSTQ